MQSGRCSTQSALVSSRFFGTVQGRKHPPPPLPPFQDFLKDFCNQLSIKCIFQSAQGYQSCAVGMERCCALSKTFFRVSQGFWGTRGHWQNIEGNISQFLGTGEQNWKNYSTKTFLESVGTWEHRAILEGNKGTRTPPLGDPHFSAPSF